MTRPPIPLFRLAAAPLALLAAMPLGAQDAPGSFSLPTQTPTPTPSAAPAGPADERAGVAIPPRNLPAPRITPEPTLTPEAPAPAPAARPSPSPRPAPLRLPQAVPTATPAPAPTATPAAPLPATPAPEPGFGTFETPAPPAPSLAEPSTPASEALGAPVLDWRWLAGGGAVLAALLGGWIAWRRRKPKVLRLAAPVALAPQDEEPVLPRIDVTVEIPGASRSVMTFTLRYRINLANRSDRAVNDLAVAVQLTSARQGESNAAPLAAAQSVTRVDRIGPHQTRSLSGEVQLPFAAITPIMQGRTMLFVPLLHVTFEGEGQQALARSFVIGTPSGGGSRVQPLRMDMLPGSAPELRARPIDLPPPA